MENSVMRLLKRLCEWLLLTSKHSELIDTATNHPGCARDIGVRISRVRLPSGEEIVMVENLREPEQEDQ
jgi:hypothetical protein